MFNQRITRFLVLGLATAISVTNLSAQTVEEEPEVVAPAGFVLPPRLRQIAFRDGNPWTFQVNARLNQGGATVAFGGLGGIATSNNVPGADVLDANVRTYDNGYVVTDAPRADELDANGNVFSVPGGRYAGLVNGVSAGDFLAYTPGQTRSWGISSGDQITANGIEFNSYETTSNGAQFTGSEDSGALGFEMAVSRRVFKLSEKTEISLAASIGLNDIKSSAAGQITANLIRLTDLYQLYGTIPADASYAAPNADDLFDTDGAVILAGGLETTVPLQQITQDRTLDTFLDGALVDGSWALKGAYYSFRIGPQIRSHLTERIAVSASLGMVGAYVGTDFEFTEVIDSSNLDFVVGVSTTQVVNHSELIIGFYGDLALEFWITPRTAFFFGIAYEGLDSYQQTVGGRTASVDLGSNTIARVGVTTRF
jgi:hypothetical protein